MFTHPTWSLSGFRALAWGVGEFLSHLLFRLVVVGERRGGGGVCVGVCVCWSHRAEQSVLKLWSCCFISSSWEESIASTEKGKDWTWCVVSEWTFSKINTRKLHCINLAADVKLLWLLVGYPAADVKLVWLLVGYPAADVKLVWLLVGFPAADVKLVWLLVGFQAADVKLVWLLVGFQAGDVKLVWLLVGFQGVNKQQQQQGHHPSPSSPMSSPLLHKVRCVFQLLGSYMCVLLCVRFGMCL